PTCARLIIIYEIRKQVTCHSGNKRFESVVATMIRKLSYLTNETRMVNCECTRRVNRVVMNCSSSLSVISRVLSRRGALFMFFEDLVRHQDCLVTKVFRRNCSSTSKHLSSCGKALREHH